MLDWAKEGAARTKAAAARRSVDFMVTLSSEFREVGRTLLAH
jgi:hypothetical protein